MKTDENKMKENGVKTAGHKMDSCCCGHGHDQPKNEAQKEGKYYCLMKCEGSKIYDQPGNCPMCNMKLISTNVKNEHGFHHFFG
jgi:hypothetical protein